ncbi:long-chain-fatty-acid--CoA ligase [Paracoccus sp. SCSIO 75233]|uniref:long-chain-fatty-acid--CoA ligase n=1 Tax=Paracoccus sp. SCSIO 75233 TaxID=3017782 RepID=UPI0022F116E4|nr:long-chain-fatty-acid--CoA ligase [Paracoccus sp. SCSIO 75233]WBU52987.1 long-chain-fatty-acid--CoA ligase [Paracoccus sp. SCSIO 75233]
MNEPNATTWPQGIPRHLPTLPASPFQSLRDVAGRVPDKVALDYYGKTISYGEMLALTMRLASVLDQEGVGKGDRVLLCLQNSPQFVISFYAISALGAVVVPVNPMNKSDEIAYLLSDTGARIIIAGQEKLDDLSALPQGSLARALLVTYSDYLPETLQIRLPAEVTAAPVETENRLFLRWAATLAQAPGQVVLPDPDPEAPSVMPYTSGTTGNPKGCVHLNRTTMTTAVGSALWLGFDEDDVQLLTLPMFHVTGMHIPMLGGILRGGSLQIMTRWDRDVAIDLIETRGITVWICIAAMVIDVVNAEGLSERDLSSLRMIMGGGAAMPEAVAKRLRDLVGLDYIEGYGLSETAAPVMINPPDAPKRACLGIPLMGVDARILDVDSLQTVPDGEQGEIIISAPQVFTGYWRRPETESETFISLDGKRFLRTGDLGYRDVDGYFYMVDRLKRMINASGYKVWPTEVEATLFKHPDIREACVIATPDERKGEAVKAFIVPRDNNQHASEDEIVAWCRERMSAYKVPRHVSFVDALPKSGTGKIMWRELQEKEWA